MKQYNDAFDPIHAAREIERSYRSYISSTIHFARKDLQQQLKTLLDTPGYLSKGPYLEATPPYIGESSTAELVNEGLLCPSMLCLGDGDPETFDTNRKLYKHQVKALRLAREHKNFIVTTGTGSGKTECFLLPIIDDLLNEIESFGPRPGVRAMILYPMNALANDQMKRLRGLLKGLPITFGRYTGETKNSQKDALEQWHSDNPEGCEPMPNEYISREHMRNEPPNILLTNYSMLEYLLLRPEDEAFFSGAFTNSWRHIAIDEAHMYSGALGTEIAYLLRRLKARIFSNSKNAHHLQCYATSATIGSSEPQELRKVAKFASDLFGEPFDENVENSVILGATNNPISDLKPIWGELPAKTWSDLRELVLANQLTKDALLSILDQFVPEQELKAIADIEDPRLGLGSILLGELNTGRLVEEISQGLIDLTPNNEGAQTNSITSLGASMLTDMVEVLSSAQRSAGVSILNSRYHAFLRGPEGLFINLDSTSLDGVKKISAQASDGDYAIPIYELAACRHCGEAYLLGNEVVDRAAGCKWLDPKPQGEDPRDPECYDPRVYYRLVHTIEDVCEKEESMWLCPKCGSLHNDGTGGFHRFEHPPVNRLLIAKGTADEDHSSCPHCRYSSDNAIQPMRVSPEAIGSIVCYDLVREIPPFDSPIAANAKKTAFSRFASKQAKSQRGGSVICFSDKRQDAAYFAPAMERTYNDITVRQIIREAVEDLYDGKHGVLPSDIYDWYQSVGSKKYKGLYKDSSPRNVAYALILGELMTDSHRNSLEGLGVLRIEPTEFIKGFDDAAGEVIRERMSLLDPKSYSWLTFEDYYIFTRHCLESLRRDGGLKVPTGAAELLACRTRTQPKTIVARTSSSNARIISFIGNSVGSENGRSAFVRKYARERHGINVSREQASNLLSDIHIFLTEYLGYLSELGQKVIHDEGAGFSLDMNLWQLYPHTSMDKVYVCDTCGCEYHWDHQSVCPTFRCQGKLVESTFASVYDKDRHYKQAYCDEPLPIQIEEHTAQLSPDKARDIQEKFLQGDVNVLSCTTTFELGVDVGDLRAVFMRNVPPTTANYTQRAGRVGRRAGKPGFAVTFARLRSHDLTLYRNPERIIKGDTPVPSCYLDNASIASRHVFAVALSEYFRYARDVYGEDISHVYHSFLDLTQDQPIGLERFRDYLEQQPESICQQLTSIFSTSTEAEKELGITDWSWTSSLVSQDEGRLVRVHDLKRDDYHNLEEAAEIYREAGEDFKLSGVNRAMGSYKKQPTIGVLAENGVLPKYGFPTDLVELHIPELDTKVSGNPLRLQRGLRQAIREYAPGNEIIANKKVWRSVGIRKRKNQDLEVRRFGRCPSCGAFVWPIDNESDETICKSCGEEVKVTNKMLIPSEGFFAELVDTNKALRRPRSKGSIRIEFCHSELDESSREELIFPNGKITLRSSKNGLMCAFNPNGSSGYYYCRYCGSAAPGNDKEMRHKPGCELKHATRYQALGAAFTSDVLELKFEFEQYHHAPNEDWESLSWAIYTAAVNALEIPEMEIGATFYPNDAGSYSILLYDNVPGGAGHSLTLAGRCDEIIRSSYNLVAGCTCGEDTCCYSCLCNYYNQARQNLLSRGGALRILQALGINSSGTESQ